MLHPTVNIGFMKSTQNFRTSLIFRTSLLFMLVWLAGCSAFFGKHGVFRSRGGDYLRASPISELTLPDGVETVPTETLYQIPQVNALDEFGDPVDLEEFDVPRPLPIGEKGSVGVKIQKLGGRQWLFINASTAQVWPRTQYFLAQYDLGVETSNAARGIIDTEWLEFSDDTDNAARYRLFLEKGIHPDTTEIHILHASYPTQALRDGARPEWPESSVDPKREAWLLEKLANTLADSVDNNAASLLGQNVGGELKAGFARYKGEPALRLNLSFVRAWGTMLYTAKQEGFATWEADSDRKILYVSYAPYDEDGPGFFARMAFWSDHGLPPKDAPYALDEVLAHLSPKEEVKQAFADIPGVAYSDMSLNQAQGYLLVVSEVNDVVYVVIRDVRGQRLRDQQAKTLLRLLRKNLI